MCCADSLEMKMMRPQFFFSMPGKSWRERRTPLRTFTSKKRSQSESGISRKGLGSKIPRLLTRMSASGTCWRNVSTPWAVPKSAGTPRRSGFPTLARIFLTATSTRASVRPLTMTLAPSAASVAAMAKPIPAVDPDTTAVLPLIFRSISRLLVDSCEFLPDANSRGYAFDLGDLARGELQFTSAHDAFGLLRVARANNGAGSRRWRLHRGYAHGVRRPGASARRVRDFSTGVAREIPDCGCENHRAAVLRRARESWPR